MGSASRRQPPAPTATGLYQPGQRLLREPDSRRQVLPLRCDAGRNFSALDYARRRRRVSQGEPRTGAADAGAIERILPAAGKGRQSLFCRCDDSRRADALRCEAPHALAVSGGESLPRDCLFRRTGNTSSSHPIRTTSCGMATATAAASVNSRSRPFMA